ncbi:MAG: threonine synthase [Rhodothermales bacterium]|nr:threonine synthase [Rhodothermales bacterium]
MAVRYQSTRGSEADAVGFVEALQKGLAPDGGLYVPVAVPGLPEGWEQSESFQDLAQRVLGNWLEGAFDDDARAHAVRDALDFDVPVVPLEGPWEGVHVLELFHGPTLSFKDFGARTMGRLLAASLEDGEEVTIMVATSGDTGSAVADGFGGIPGVRVVLLYPDGQVSPTQERQLIVERQGVTALRVDGTFDDCQRMVKGAFADPALADVTLSSANSINIGRLLPQSLYYLWASLQVASPARFCVPSGNLGNLTAAVLAQLGGLRVSGFVAAHNANRFFPDYLEGEDADFEPSIQTLSNAMDVGAPSNFERLEWLLGRDRLQAHIQGMSISDDETMDSMARVYNQTGYVADPHTAVGLEAVRRLRYDWDTSEPIIVASTAHPAKFPESVSRAIGRNAEVPERLAAFWERPTSVREIPASGEALRDVILE